MPDGRRAIAEQLRAMPEIVGERGHGGVIAQRDGEGQGFLEEGRRGIVPPPIELDRRVEDERPHQIGDVGLASSQGLHSAAGRVAMCATHAAAASRPSFSQARKAATSAMRSARTPIPIPPPTQSDYFRR